MTLEQVIADWRGDAAVLRRQGHSAQAELLEHHADQVAAAAPDYLNWLTEDEARLWSGRAVKWLRSQFDGWERDGHARREGRKRLYRALILPRRADTARAYREGRAAA